MTNRFSYFVILFIVCGLHYSCTARPVEIKSDDPAISYTGRVAVGQENAMLSWSGSSATINFEGSSVKAVLMDEHGRNYYNVMVDGKLSVVINPEKDKKEYTLVSGLPAGKHTLELFKRTEWGFGRTWLYGFILDGGKLLPAPAKKKRKIEFFGDSITCGYAVEDTTGLDRGLPPYENAWKSYAAITARRFDAEYRSITCSGIGLLISGFPIIMPELYNRFDPFDTAGNWDFNEWQPDVVVINLFQNDSWLVQQPNMPQFKVRFGTKAPSADGIVNAYGDFIKTLRGKYPKAYIICALGNMDASNEGSVWPGYIQKAVANTKDARVHSLIFPGKNTPGHPSATEQQAMANDLIKFISTKLKW